MYTQFKFVESECSLGSHFAQSAGGLEMVGETGRNETDETWLFGLQKVSAAGLNVEKRRRG